MAYPDDCRHKSRLLPLRLYGSCVLHALCIVHVASHPWVTVLGLLLPLWEYASCDSEVGNLVCSVVVVPVINAYVSVQVKQPLSVSYNKLGDLEYGLGNVEAAVNWYKQGLCIREEAVQGNERAGPSEQLDVAVSTIKVADACQVRPFCGQQSMRQRWFVFNCMQATCRLLSTAVTAALAALGRVNNTSLSQSQLLLHKASCSICQQSVLAFSVNNAEHLDVARLRQVHWC